MAALIGQNGNATENRSITSRVASKAKGCESKGFNSSSSSVAHFNGRAQVASSGAERAAKVNVDNLPEGVLSGRSSCTEDFLAQARAEVAPARPLLTGAEEFGP